MKRKLLSFCLSALSLSINAATVARYNGSRIYWDSRVPVTVFNGGGYGRLIQLADGRLMACCESGGIKVCFSSNQGKSWTEPRLIAPNANNTPNCVPDLVQLADGTILVAYNPRPSTPYTEDRRFGIRLRRSTTGGKTWSDEIFVYDADYTFENGCWEPSFLQLPSGELQLYFADESPYTQSGEQQISMCRSFDGELTWTAPKRISFRSGFRDGMPVPILLSDSKTIVVAIEDNGWSGIGDFVPTTVRTTITNNWKDDYYISGTSSQRSRSINYDYCPIAKGGAPYLRVLPSGETVLSHQSTFGDGDNMKMYVYVGNKTAKDFKAMSRPFYQGTTKGSWWNSLAVIDTGIVVAVGGLDGKIVMTKGYPMKQFVVPFGTQLTDGHLTSEDSYLTSNARQVPMGSQTGTFAYTDFCYDFDRLYITCLVYRRNARSQQPFPDGINFYVESKGASTDGLLPTSYRFSMLPDGTLTVARGSSSGWTPCDIPDAQAASYLTSSNYRLELAIPWTAIGLPSAPIGEKLSVNLEILSGDGTQQLVESIPDASPTKPATWVLLNLLEPDPTGIEEIENGKDPLTPFRGNKWKIENGKWKVESGQIVNRKSSNSQCFDLSGRMVKRQLPKGFYVVGSKKVVFR
ncbi:MAG: exo-alpha-sialidase [Bacteroidaceae bacterium]|nr:exo-alpha-sialidase [Bacteroidaceae bacterium]